MLTIQNEEALGIRLEILIQKPQALHMSFLENRKEYQMAAYKPTNQERETIILSNMAENIAEIYTYDPSLIRKLEALSQVSSEIRIKHNKDSWGAATYFIPKNLISIRSPRAKKILSEEEKEAKREQFNKNLSR